MYKFGSPKSWDKPTAVVYKPTYYEEDSVGLGARAISRQIVLNPNMLNDIAVVLERPDVSYLNEGAVVTDNAAIAVTVFRDELYSHSRIDPERRAEIKDTFGVIPLDSGSILFQGVIFDGESGSFFHPVDSDFVSHRAITDEDLMLRQRNHAQVFLSQPHPTDSRTTPIGMLLSLGIKPVR